MGVFNHPDVYLERNTVGCKQSRRLLEYTEDNFLDQVVDSPNRRDTTDLFLTVVLKTNSMLKCIA